MSVLLRLNRREITLGGLEIHLGHGFGRPIGHLVAMALGTWMQQAVNGFLRLVVLWWLDYFESVFKSRQELV